MVLNLDFDEWLDALRKPDDPVDVNALQWADVVGIIGGYWSIFGLVEFPLKVNAFCTLSIFDGTGVVSMGLPHCRFTGIVPLGC